MSTLSELVELLAADLQDTDYLIWSAEDHTRNIRRALAHYSALNPLRASALLDTVPGQREHDISALGALDVGQVWYPYDPESPSHPPECVAFSLLDRQTLYLESDAPPSGAKLRLFYLAPHTIAGLDGAATTSLDASGEELIVLLATASAAMQRCQAVIGKVTVNGWTPQQLLAWAEARQAAADRAWDALRRRLVLAGDPRIPWDIPA